MNNTTPVTTVYVHNDKEVSRHERNTAAKLIATQVAREVAYSLTTAQVRAMLEAKEVLKKAQIDYNLAMSEAMKTVKITNREY